MTAKTTDFSSLIYHNPAGPGFNSTPDYSITASKTTVNEGEALTFTIRAWGWPDGSNFVGGPYNLSVPWHRFTTTTTPFANYTCTSTTTLKDDKLINGAAQTYTAGIGFPEGPNGEIIYDYPPILSQQVTVTDTSQYAAVTSNPTNAGLTYEVGIGYWNNNFNFSYTIDEGPVSNFAPPMAPSITGYTALSVKIAGYFKAPTTGNHTISFTMTGSSAPKMQMYMWLGENALSPSLANRVDFTPSFNFNNTLSFTAALTANQLLPILVIASAPNGVIGADTLTITGSDLTGKVFHL
jgi:hypothetical protein